MSYEAKGKYEVLRIVRASVMEGLEAFGIKNFECIEFAQPLLQSADRVVLLKQTGQRRVGWQRASYSDRRDVGDGSERRSVRREAWIEEQDWELTVVFKRDGAAVTEYTMTSEDVAFSLVAWFNSLGGIERLRASDCANLFVSPSSVRPYKDDSHVYQNTSTLTVQIQVPKVFEFAQPMATPVFKGISGV